jgi:hypothetical protein
MITFDGVRLVYVGESGSFTLYTWQTEKEMYNSARDGCADLCEAEKAAAECAAHLAIMLELMEDYAA